MARLTLDRILTEREQQAVADFQERLHRALPGQVDRIILFGSKARGDAHPDSDIDLLVVLQDRTRAAVEAVVEAQLGALDRTGVFVTPLIYSQQEAEEDQALGTPFMQNVAEEGIVIEGEAIMVNEVKREELARELLDSARERLRITKILIDNKGYRDAVSRAYYAFLDAGDALLVVKGFTPKSHSGTLHLFKKHFADTGLVEVRYHRWFAQAEQDRLDADYPRRGRILAAEDAQRALRRAEEFVAMAENLLPVLLGEEE